jgi:hypothetical protein
MTNFATRIRDYLSRRPALSIIAFQFEF